MTEFTQSSILDNKIKKEENLIATDKFRKSLINTSIIVMYSAAAVGSSSILIFVPNLETISFFIFLVAFVFGFRIGIQMMLTTSIVFELFATSVYGFGGWLIIFKIFAYFIFVVIASMLNKSLEMDKITENLSKDIHKSEKIFFKDSKKGNLYNMIFFFVLGFSLTIIFDIVTTLSLFLIIPSVQVLIGNFIFGLPYYLFHETTNGLLFMLIPVVSQLIKNSSNYSN